MDVVSLHKDIIFHVRCVTGHGSLAVRMLASQPAGLRFDSMSWHLVKHKMFHIGSDSSFTTHLTLEVKNSGLLVGCLFV